jgi:hypothetical protein
MVKIFPGWRDSLTFFPIIFVFSQFYPSDFTADGFGQFIDKFNDPGNFEFCQYADRMFKQFQGKRPGWLVFSAKMTKTLQAVGGAQKEFILYFATVAMYFSTFRAVKANPVAVAPTLNGAKKLLHAYFPHPGALRLWWTSPGSIPSMTEVDRWPKGYDAALCPTRLGSPVVPDVKKQNRTSSFPTSAGSAVADSPVTSQ